MTDQPKPPINRPASARPRGAAGDAAAGETKPPSAAELAAIEYGFADLSRHSGADVRRAAELDAVVVLLSGRGVGYNFVACPRWAGINVPGRLAQVARTMRGDGEWPALVVADGVSEPPTLADELAAAGWFRLEGELVMATRRPAAVPHLDSSLRIAAVTARTTEEYEALERAVFGLAPDFAATRREHLAASVDRGDVRAYLVRLRGEAVATARLAGATGEQIRGIYGVGVAAAHRRQGLGTLVTAVATRAALASGSALAWLSVDERNESALGVYRRLGFTPAYRWSRWVGPEV